MAPAVVEAQETRIRAESVVVVDDSGTNRATMSTGPGARSAVELFSEGGIPRISMNTGGGGGAPGGIGTEPDAASVSVWPPEGSTASPGDIRPIARLGTPDDGVGSVMYLRDRQGHFRIMLQVDGDGNPSIEMRDASGNVTWRAQ